MKDFRLCWRVLVRATDTRVSSPMIGDRFYSIVYRNKYQPHTVTLPNYETKRVPLHLHTNS